jgi:hypothetical protein
VVDETTARLRLAPSDGEILCPVKRSLLGIGRCLEFQADTGAAGKACTCSVFLARSGQRVPQQEPDQVDQVHEVVQRHVAPAPPKAEKQKPTASTGGRNPPRPDRRSLIAAHAKRKAAGRAAAATSSFPASIEAAKPEPKETTMAERDGATARVLAAMAAKPGEVFSRHEIAGIKGGSHKAVSPMLLRLIAQKKVVRDGDGFRIAAGAAREVAKAPAKQPTEERAAPPRARGATHAA